MSEIVTSDNCKKEIKESKKATGTIDATPPRTPTRSQSPVSCAICLGPCINTSFTDSCLHKFCFNCLVTWSKVKAECPLCKQIFKSIIHNVQSDNVYEVYKVEAREVEINADIVEDNAPRFRYRTTLTLARRETLAIQQLLTSPLFSATENVPIRRNHQNFRRSVYRLNLWARPLPDFTGRFRQATPEFYRYNPAQVHRLVPWLSRELSYLLNNNPGHINYVMSRIIDLLSEHMITSQEFCSAVRPYFGDRVDHFVHELYNFAISPYDLNGYDRTVQYSSEPRVPAYANEIISSGSDGGNDSDVEVVGYNGSRQSNQPQGNVISIETITQTESDDSSSEIIMVGYIKPPQERTPEIVDLIASDSDVQELEESFPGPSTSTAPSVYMGPSTSNLVKVSLRENRSGCSCKRQNEESDSNKPFKKRVQNTLYQDYSTTSSDTTYSSETESYSYDTNSYSSSSSSSSCSYKYNEKRKRKKQLKVTKNKGYKKTKTKDTKSYPNRKSKRKHADKSLNKPYKKSKRKGECKSKKEKNVEQEPADVVDNSKSVTERKKLRSVVNVVYRDDSSNDSRSHTPPIDRNDNTSNHDSA